MQFSLFNLIFIITTIATQINGDSNAAEFCNLGCAEPNTTHGVCVNPEKKFIDKCSQKTKILPLKEFQHIILKAHNAMREKIASGIDTGLPPASHLGEMFWDSELAEIAEYSARRCLILDPYCYTTPKYAEPGRSANIIKIPHTHVDYADILEIQINKWLSVISFITPDMVVSFPENPENHEDFSGRAILESNNYVGCAVSQFKDLSGHLKNLLVCFYPSDVEEGERLYRIGSARTRCNAGPSKKYDSLCDKGEKYDNTDNRFKEIGPIGYRSISRSRRRKPKKKKKKKKGKYKVPEGGLWTLML